ncbi:MAG: hypothetical protein IKQ72_12340 [Bacteroidaceae bacterium]|nr:hypothetical protein [Bacteroidaceae bacterium]
MKFYKLKFGCDNEIVGNQYPQVWDFLKGYSPKPEDNGLFTLYDDDKLFPDKEPDLSGLKLASGAQYTDFMSNGFDSCLYLFSEKAKGLLENLNLDMHRIYPAKVTSLRKKTSRDYYMMKIISRKWEFVDFSNSELYEEIKDGEDFDDVIINPVTIRSLEEFREKYDNTNFVDKWNYNIRAKRIKMLDSFYDLGLDMFKLDRFDFSWYVSERFFDMVLSNNLTGLEFEKVDM